MKFEKLFDRQHPWKLAVNTFALLFLPLLLIINRFDSFSLAILSISGLILFVLYMRKELFSRFDLALICVFTALLLVMLLSYLAGYKTDIGFRMLGRNIRLLLFIPTYILFRFYPPRGFAIFSGAALAATVVAIYGYFFGELNSFSTRVAGAADPITYGNLALVFGFSSLSLVIAAPDRNYRKYLYWLSAIGLLCGLIGSFLSGSRGGWLAIPPLVVVSTIFLVRNTRALFWRASASLFIVIAIAVAFSPSKLLSDRVSLGLKEASAFFDRPELHHQQPSMTGCINERNVLDDLLQGIEDTGYMEGLEGEVIDDGENLLRDKLHSNCQSKYVIEIQNKSPIHAAAFVVPRSVMKSDDEQNISLLVKGRGAVNINGGVHREIDFDAQSYQRIDLRDQSIAGNAPFPVFTLAPGQKLYFVPITLQPGEYVWYYSLQSVGKRAEMWWTAWLIFLNHPILGAGIGAYKHFAAEYIHEYMVSPVVGDFDHPHNDFLNVLYGEGLIGLLAFILLLGTPFYIYMSSIGSKDATTRATAFCGIIMNIAVPIFGLTEAMFVHSLVLSWYVVMTAMLCAIIRVSDRDHHQGPP